MPHLPLDFNWSPFPHPAPGLKGWKTFFFFVHLVKFKEVLGKNDSKTTGSGLEIELNAPLKSKVTSQNVSVIFK